MPRGKKADLARWIEEHRPERIGEEDFSQIRAALAPVSESYLRTLLRESGAPLDPLVEGIRQSNLEELENGLTAFAGLYEQGDPAKKSALRKLVITAKDHARLAARSANASDEKRSEKEEMLLWLLTWLENPPLFPGWVRIRRGLLRN